MQIIAFGGGGFSAELKNSLDDYIFSQARSKRPRVCYIPTANAENDASCLRFYEAMAQRDCQPSHLLLFRRNIEDLRSFILRQDLFYVAGGNTANLLAVWRVHGLDQLLREAAENGALLAGGSAGSICWFESGVSDSFGPTLQPLRNALGFLPGSHCPHYDGETQRRPTYRRLIKEGLPAGYAIDDWAAIHFENRRIKRIVTARPNATAYRVELKNGEVAETALPAELLPESTERLPTHNAQIHPRQAENSMRCANSSGDPPL